MGMVVDDRQNLGKPDHRVARVTWKTAKAVRNGLIKETSSFAVCV